MDKYRVIISGGGTGGHIFPAIAIANAIKKRFVNSEILFVGAEGKMEMEKVPAAGYKIIGLNIQGFQRGSIIKNLLLPFKLISSLIKAKKVVKEFKPHVAIGVGGYASGPLLKVAESLGVPTLLQEQNSFPGKTNIILSKKADRICVAYDGMERFFPKEKIILTGNPVRQEVVHNLEGKKIRGAEYFGLDENKKTLLVIGGSLGARTINQSIEKSLPMFVENNIQVVWQTGKWYHEQALKVAEKYGDSGIKVYDFISRMDYAYAIADLVVSRAGAISVSELCIAGKACVLVPSPNVAEDHQTKNALALVNHGAAILIKDNEAVDALGKKVIELFNDNDQQEKLKLNILKLAHLDAADLIANEAINLIHTKHGEN